MNDEAVVVLTLRSQKGPGEKIFRLHKKRVVFGSATSSDIRLDDASVSPVHAILEVSGIDGNPVIYDLASETGIQINGKTEVQATLNPNDQFQIGPYMIGVRIQSAGEVPEPPADLVKESYGQKLYVDETEDLKPLILEDFNTAGGDDVFDRKPETKESLEVVMFYKDTILEVEHFVDKKRIVIGPGAKDDFSIPPFLGEGKHGRFDLVTKENGQYNICLHDSMRGVVSQDGKLTPVQDVSTVTSTASSKVHPLKTKDFAKVSLKDVSFFLRFTPAPPKLRTRRILRRDKTFFKIWLISLLLTIFMIWGLSKLEVNPTIEIEQLPERVATIIYEPKFLPVERRPEPKSVEKETKPVEKPKPKPKKVIKIKPKPVTKKTKAKVIDAQGPRKKKPKVKATTNKKVAKTRKKPRKAKVASGKEGAGARTKGIEGSRGKKKAKRRGTPQTKAKRKGRGKKGAATANRTGRSQVPGGGVVDVFRKNKGTLSKLFAGGSGASNAAKKLEGYSGFTTKGSGGLGEAGSGSGGGGKSLGLGGLAKKGPGGGKRGKGLGAFGRGGNMLGGKGKIMVSSAGSPEPIVLGGIDSDAVARELEKYRDQFRYCYEKEINAENPNLAGRIGVRFVIGASGSVTRAGITSSSIKNANVERCVISVIKRIQFPPIRGGGIAEVSYPFVFKPSNR